MAFANPAESKEVKSPATVMKSSDCNNGGAAAARLVKAAGGSAKAQQIARDAYIAVCELF